MAKNQVKRTSIGGQALIEGVMMRGPKKTAMAVRLKSGKIVLEEWENDLSKKPFVYRTPFVRGIFNFIDSMVVGYKTLMRSAELSEYSDAAAEAAIEEARIARLKKSGKSECLEHVEDIEVIDKEDSEQINIVDKENEITTKDDDKTGKDDKLKDEKSIGNDIKEDEDDEPLSAVVMGIVMVVASMLSMVIAVGLFIWLPTATANLLKKVLPVMSNRVVQSSFEGVLKIIIFLVYMFAISCMEDIKRVFMYHGAEHKTIFCFEHEQPLDVENVKKQCRFHPRCGTSFIVLMLVISIMVAIFIPNSIPAYLRTAIKLCCLPITMGIGYEAIKLAGRKENTFTKIMSAPGLWVQRISTKEPCEDYMIECAIKAFIAVLPEKDKEKYNIK